MSFLCIRRHELILGLVAIALVLAPTAAAQGDAAPAVPTVDGDSGTCTVDFTVVDGEGNKVDGALLRLSVDFGFLGRHELDLEVRTNAEGRARFVGLPEKADGVLFFAANKERLKGIAVANPQDSCAIHHAIIMAPPGALLARDE